MLRYIGTNELKIKGHGIIFPNDIIKNEELCKSLKGRTDFVNVEADPKPKIGKARRIIKSRKYKRK